MKTARNLLFLAALAFLLSAPFFIFPKIASPQIFANTTIIGPTSVATGPSDMATGPLNIATGPNSKIDDPCEDDPFYYYYNGNKIWVTSCPDSNSAGYKQFIIRKFKKDFDKAMAAGDDTEDIVQSFNNYIKSPDVQQYIDTNPEFASQIYQLQGEMNESIAPQGADLAAGKTNSGTSSAPDSSDPDQNSPVPPTTSQTDKKNLPAENQAPCAGIACGDINIDASTNSTTTLQSSKSPANTENDPSASLNSPGNNTGNNPGNNDPASANNTPAQNSDNPSGDNLPLLTDSQADFSVQADTTSIELKIIVEDAQGVYFYIEGGSSPPPIYLGSGILSGESTWVYRVDLEKDPLPNGRYQVWAKVYINGTAYRVNKSAIDILMAIAGGSQDDLAQSLKNNESAAISLENDIDRLIASTTEEIVKKTGADRKVVENLVRQIAQLVRDLRQINNLYLEKSIQLEAVNAKIKNIKESLDELPENAIEIIKTDKLWEISDLEPEIGKIESEINGASATKDDKDRRIGDFSRELLTMAANIDIQTEITQIIDNFKSRVAAKEDEVIGINRLLTLDTDNDGLYDRREIALGTDAFSPDTDGDGALDGDEIANGYDPKKTNRFPKITYHSPREIPPRKTDTYRFDDQNAVAALKLGNDKSAIKFAGQGLPNAYITLFMFSEPVIVVVKTDRYGRWTYVLDKPVEDGMHTVYAAQTDSTGQVEARSEVMVFLKNGDEVKRVFANQEASIAASTEKMKGNFGIVVAVLTLLALTASLAMIGIAAMRAKKDRAQNQNPSA